MDTSTTSVSRVIPALFTVNCAFLLAGYAVDLIFGNGTFTYWFGFIPYRLTHGILSLDPGGFAYGVFTGISYAFLHGGIMHFFSNMAILMLFGAYVEESMGSRKFLGFYLLCGFLAALFHMLFNFTTSGAVIGASGAVSGIGGAFIVLLLYRKIPVNSFTLMGTVVIAMWLWGQFQGAFQDLIGSNATGIAYLTHLGGFLAGFAISMLSQRQKSSNKIPSEK
ncbi:MAG: rhomboid family intramembrane serine protease [Candidatus Obscuribacterales bacterium]|nr:rhomboid family intramembrane serine protease [Candidatus Obscuribacterales bacterium]